MNKETARKAKMMSQKMMRRKENTMDVGEIIEMNDGREPSVMKKKKKKNRTY